MNSALHSSPDFQPAQIGGFPPVDTARRFRETPARRFFPSNLKVSPAVGVHNQLTSYLPPSGNLRCPVCETIVTASAPDSLLRERKGWIFDFCLALARKRYHKRHGKEVPCMNQPQEYATKIAKGYDRIAAIVAKTVALRGDAFELDDAQALVMIMDTLNDIDPTLIERNKNKRLTRSRRPS